MTKDNCLDHIDTAISLLQDLKEILDDGDADAPQAFLELAQDAQDQIGKAIHAAIVPVLRSTRGN